MRVTSTEQMDLFPDQQVKDEMLPELFHHTTNSEEFIFCKMALQEAIETELEPVYREVLQEYYWNKKTKTQIAMERQVVPSTIVKQIKKAECLVRQYVSFALRVYQRQKREISWEC